MEAIKVASDPKSAKALAKLRPEDPHFQSKLFVLTNANNPLNKLKGKLIEEMEDKIAKELSAFNRVSDKAQGSSREEALMLTMIKNIDGLQKVLEAIKMAPDAISAKALAISDPNIISFIRNIRISFRHR